MAKENITRAELAPKAKEMMDAHGLSEVFVCSDKQGFTDKERANDHSRYLVDKTVHHFEVDKSPKVLTENTEIQPKKTDEERAQLVARYEELFGKKPAHNIGVEKLKASIEEKEAELKALENSLVSDDNGQTSDQKTEENPAETKED